MKDKKKLGLVKRIAAILCAVVVAVSSLGMSAPCFANASITSYTTYTNIRNQPCNYEYEINITMDDVRVSDDIILNFFIRSDSPIFFVLGKYIDDNFVYKEVAYSGVETYSVYFYSRSPIYYYDGQPLGYLYQYELADGSVCYATSTYLGYPCSSGGINIDGNLGVCANYTQVEKNKSEHDLVFNSNLFDLDADEFGNIYNSSLGYLQNILCKELYLEDADYAYDPNYLKKIWTFGNTSTAGLDITDGSYSIRHYQQITVRNTDLKNPVVKEYDMILMNEFPVASLRYEYMSKDYTSRLEAEGGFEPLGFWETSILGQFVFTRNYFQLVRTNEDGSVEYGGLVKIDLKGSPSANDLNAEHETTTVTPEGVVDQDGYVGGNMDYIQGSGSDYGQAENNADKEYEKENSSSGGSKDLAAQVENLIAVVMAVPRLIAELFSFLPPWCLDFVGVAFTISIGILVFKLAN